mgnify:CR=1 FL=1
MKKMTESCSNGEKRGISSQNFLDSVVYRAKNFGRLIGKDAGEGFTSKQTLSVDNIEALIS